MLIVSYSFIFYSFYRTFDGLAREYRKKQAFNAYLLSKQSSTTTTLKSSKSNSTFNSSSSFSTSASFNTPSTGNLSLESFGEGYSVFECESKIRTSKPAGSEIQVQQKSESSLNSESDRSFRELSELIQTLFPLVRPITSTDTLETIIAQYARPPSSSSSSSNSSAGTSSTSLNSSQSSHSSIKSLTPKPVEYKRKERKLKADHITKNHKFSKGVVMFCHSSRCTCKTLYKDVHC